MRFDTHAFTSPGARSINEDALSWCADETGGAWVVADGLGGHAFGELASQTVVDAIIEAACTALPTSDDACRALVEQANGTLLRRQCAQPAHAGMRSTVVAAFAAGGLLHPVHAGDSRLYLFRENGILFRTRDDSMSQLAVELGEIRPEGIRFHEDRNALTQVLGNTGRLRLRPQQAVSLRPGDAFLLCTDGFWEYVLEDEMLAALAATASAEGWLEQMLKAHAARLESMGKGQKNDNYTAVCCRVADV